MEDVDGLKQQNSFSGINWLESSVSADESNYNISTNADDLSNFASGTKGFNNGRVKVEQEMNHCFKEIFLNNLTMMMSIYST